MQSRLRGRTFRRANVWWWTWTWPSSLDGGGVVDRHLGTPQGGTLSPLLANVLLDEVDKALEARGYSFARYADDCKVYVGSKRAG